MTNVSIKYCKLCFIPMYVLVDKNTKNVYYYCQNPLCGKYGCYS